MNTRLKLIGIALIIILASAYFVFGKKMGIPGACAQEETLNDTPSAVPGDSLNYALSVNPVFRSIPEFGGAYTEDDRILYVYLTDRSKEEQVKVALGEMLRLSGMEGKEVELRIIPAKYRYYQLVNDFQNKPFAWRSVSSTWVSERHNAVGVGVDPAECIPAIEKKIVDEGLPADAYRVEFSPRAVVD